MMISLFLVLYCSKKHGSGEPLKDYSSVELTPPPNWAINGVLYQIFPRAFSREGTFRAIQDKLDCIKSLGVDIIWLMPINPIGRKGRKGELGSPYAVRDPWQINSDYGTEADFSNLVQAIHEMGMKIILDIVPNHGSNDHVMMASHPAWFRRDEMGEFIRKDLAWNDVTDYNYDEPELREYILKTLIYWIWEFDIDGYRCDVAGMVPYDFWQEALVKLKALKNDIYLLAEWEDPEILKTGFHSDYGWTEYNALLDIRKGKKKAFAFMDIIYERDTKYPRNALPMRFLENHDEDRSLSQFGPEAIEAFATLLFTLPGIPLIYAGQEMGEVSKPSLFEKSVLDWELANFKFFEIYKTLIKLRKSYSCFTSGEFIPLKISSVIGTAGAFIREDQYSAALIVTNLNRHLIKNATIKIPAALGNRWKDLTFINYKDSNNNINLDNVYFGIVPGFSTSVYVMKR